MMSEKIDAKEFAKQVKELTDKNLIYLLEETKGGSPAFILMNECLIRLMKYMRNGVRNAEFD